MTDVGQVLLTLVRYASDRRKPAVLRVHSETILLLRSKGLIELQEDGYWITTLGREVVSWGGPIEKDASYIPEALASEATREVRAQ